MSSTLSAFHWQGTPSEIGKTLTKTQTAPKTAPKPITYSKKQKLSTGHALIGAVFGAVCKKNGPAKPDNNSSSIPPRAQPHADTDRRHALRKHRKGRGPAEHAGGVMSAAISDFHWKTGEPSELTKALGRTQTAPKKPAPPITCSKKPAHALRKASTGNAFTGAGGQIKPGKSAAVYKTNGLVKPKNSGFDIPSRAQAQADTDRRHALVKGGI